MCIGGCAVKLALFDITRDSVLGGLNVTSRVLAHLLMADRSCSKCSAALSRSSTSIMGAQLSWLCLISPEIPF